MMATKVVE